MAVDYIDLGKRVRAARREMGMTQEELAEAAGISASFLGHIERGSRVASIDTLVALCNTLNVSPQHLLSVSLTPYDNHMPDDLTPEHRNRLSEFLRLAQDTLSNWND